MAKELPYFRFTVSEWLQGDISLEDYETKGVFIDVCSYYWFKDCSVTVSMLEKRFRDAPGEIHDLLNLEILKKDDENNVTIHFLDEQFDLLSEKRRKRVDAGRKGGLSKSSKAKAKLKQNPSYKDKDKENYNNKDKRFTPPTLDQVISYCKERDNKVDAQRFIDFYEAKGWMIGKNRIKNWKAAVRTWENGDKPQVKEKNLYPGYKDSSDFSEHENN